MKWRVLIIPTLLAGCTTLQAAQPQLVWMRIDGKRAADNPALVQQFYADGNACQVQAYSVANGVPATQVPGGNVSVSQSVTIGPPPPLATQIYTPTFAPNPALLGAAIDQNNRNRVFDNVMQTCMGAKGYVLRPQPAT